jgi:hypothetical protein
LKTDLFGMSDKCYLAVPDCENIHEGIKAPDACSTCTSPQSCFRIFPEKLITDKRALQIKLKIRFKRFALGCTLFQRYRNVQLSSFTNNR